MINDGIIFRPPGEADSLILRVAQGCPWNRCAFCGMYKEKKYRFPGLEAVIDGIRRSAAACPGGASGVRRIFLADGDAMHLDYAILEQILSEINGLFKNVRRISLYANGASILAKTPCQLRRLGELRLHTLYMGLESGDDITLKQVAKRETSGEMVASCVRAQEAGLRMSVMALVGLGGRERSAIHARATAGALNSMQPRLLSLLRLIVVPGTPMASSGFRMLSEHEAVVETRELISGLELERTVFRADHVSNIVPLEGRFPKDKPRLLAALDALLASGQLDRRTAGPLPAWL